MSDENRSKRIRLKKVGVTAAGMLARFSIYAFLKWVAEQIFG